MTKWREGSRLDLFNEGVKRLGYEHIPLAWGLVWLSGVQRMI